MVLFVAAAFAGPIDINEVEIFATSFLESGVYLCVKATGILAVEVLGCVEVDGCVLCERGCVGRVDVCVVGEILPFNLGMHICACVCVCVHVCVCVCGQTPRPFHVCGLAYPSLLSPPPTQACPFFLACLLSSPPHLNRECRVWTQRLLTHCERRCFPGIENREFVRLCGVKRGVNLQSQ